MARTYGSTPALTYPYEKHMFLRLVVLVLCKIIVNHWKMPGASTRDQVQHPQNGQIPMRGAHFWIRMFVRLRTSYENTVKNAWREHKGSSPAPTDSREGCVFSLFVVQTVGHQPSLHHKQACARF